MTLEQNKCKWLDCMAGDKLAECHVAFKEAESFFIPSVSFWHSLRETQ